jgi:hypothetical protein
MVCIAGVVVLTAGIITADATGLILGPALMLAAVVLLYLWRSAT